MVLIGEQIIRFGVMGEEELARAYGYTRDQMDEFRDAVSGTRTQLLFLSFALLASGGLLLRWGTTLGRVTSDMIGAFEKVNWQATVTATILGEFGEEGIAPVTEEMIRLGIKTEWTAEQAGLAMRRLAMAGFSTAEAIGATEATLRLATIGLTDVETAADLAVGVFRGFSYEARNAADANAILSGIVSELAYAATHSALTIEQLGESLKFAAAAADAVGWSLEEVVAGLMIAADSMVRAGIAGRAMRMSMIRLTKAAAMSEKKTLRLKDVVRMYNLTLVDSEGNILGLADTVDMLNERLGNLTSAEKEAALAALFGARSLTMWNALMRAGGDEIRRRELALAASAAREAIWVRTAEDGVEQLIKWRKEALAGRLTFNYFTEQLGYTADEAEVIMRVIGDATFSQEQWTKIVREATSAEEIAIRRLESMHGAIILLKSSVDALFVSFAKQLAPIIVAFYKILRDVIDWITENCPGVIKFLIAGFMLFGFVVFTLGGKILLFCGTLMMMAAALALVSKQSLSAAASQNLFAIGIRIVKEQIKFMLPHLGRLIAQLGILMVITYAVMYVWQEYGPVVGAVTAAILGLCYIMLFHRKLLLTTIPLQIKSILLTIKQKIATWLHTSAIIGATSAQLSLNAAMYACPLIWFAGAILGVCAVVWLLWTNWERVTGAIQAAGEALIWFGTTVIEAITGGIRWIIDQIQKLIGWFAELGRKAEELGKWFWDLIGGSIIPEAFESGTALIGRYLEGLTKQLEALPEAAEALRIPEMITPPLIPPRAERRVIIRGTRIDIRFERLEMRRPVEPPELAETVRLAVSEALDKWAAEFERELV